MDPGPKISNPLGVQGCVRGSEGRHGLLGLNVATRPAVRKGAAEEWADLSEFSNCALNKSFSSSSFSADYGRPTTGNLMLY